MRVILNGITNVVISLLPLSITIWAIARGIKELKESEKEHGKEKILVLMNGILAIAIGIASLILAVFVALISFCPDIFQL